MGRISRSQVWEFENFAIALCQRCCHFSLINCWPLTFSGTVAAEHDMVWIKKIRSLTVIVIPSCFEESAKPEGKALCSLVNLCSNPYQWSWALGNDGNHKYKWLRLSISSLYGVFCSPNHILLDSNWHIAVLDVVLCMSCSASSTCEQLKVRSRLEKSLDCLSDFLPLLEVFISTQ